MHVPLLYSRLQFDADVQPCRSLHYGPEQQLLPEADNLDACEPRQPVVDLEHCVTDPLQPTFPTPSELLAELAAKDLPATNDHFGTDSRTESASKARRRAIAKSIGFIPTDPSVTTISVWRSI